MASVLCRLADGLSTSANLASTLLQVGILIALAFLRVIKRDKTHYIELKYNKHFDTWNCGFVATAFMYRTQFVLDGEYVAVTPTGDDLFRKMQIFMYAVFEENLTTDKHRSLVSSYNSRRNAQSIYKELTKHAKCSTAAQLSGDTFLN
jgi:hypothetical protein